MAEIVLCKRKSEIFGLKWHDVDVKRNIISLLDTKNGEKREVPMNEQVKTALIRARKHPESAHIFCDANGELCHDIRKSFSTVPGKSGINNFRFQGWRPVPLSRRPDRIEIQDIFREAAQPKGRDSGPKPQRRQFCELRREERTKHDFKLGWLV